MSNVALTWAWKCHVGNAPAKAVLVTSAVAMLTLMLASEICVPVCAVSAVALAP